MISKGRRRGGAKKLSDHLRNAEDNEKIIFHELEGFAFDKADGPNLEKALKEMEAIGYGKGDPRNLYHAIIAPAYGETLNKAQRDFMVNYYAEHMGFKNHQFALVEHWKNGKQHFHLVFNIINSITGKTHELNYTKQKEWRISRGLEEILGLSTPKLKGKEAPTWAIQRGNNTGIDPRKVRKEITSIYKSSKSTKDFIAALDKAGYALTRGRRNQLVLVDRLGDTHGLLRNIEGRKLADLRQKFHGIDKIPLPHHAILVKMRKPIKGQSNTAPRIAIDPKKVSYDVQRAYKTSKTGAEFFARINKKEYSIGRGTKGFAIIDKNGGKHDLKNVLGKEATKGLYKKFPDLRGIKPSPLMELAKRMKTGKPTRVMRHPIGRTSYPFRTSGNSITRRSYQPSMGFRGGVIASLMLRMANVARVRAYLPPKTRNNFFPFMRRKKRKIHLNEPSRRTMSRADIERAEILRYAFENGRLDILAQYGIYMLPENAEPWEMAQFGFMADIFEP